MTLFSERYGYTQAENIIIRERITKEILNAICNCIVTLKLAFRKNSCFDCYVLMNEYLWIYFFNKKKKDFQKYFDVLEDYILEDNTWFDKLNILECAIQFLTKNYAVTLVPKAFTNHLNCEFKRLNFAYRIINNQIIDITSLNKPENQEEDRFFKKKYIELFSFSLSQDKSVDEILSSGEYLKYETKPFAFFLSRLFRKRISI